MKKHDNTRLRNAKTLGTTDPGLLSQ